MNRLRFRLRIPRRGFTLVELMVSLVIASIVVIMLLGIFARISFAYREQQQVVSLTRSLAAAREALEYDAQHAGFGMTQGFRTSASNNLQSPVRIINSSTAPDTVSFYYADPTKQSLVMANANNDAQFVEIDYNPGWAANELVVISTANTSVTNPLASNEEVTQHISACVVTVDRVEAGSPTSRLYFKAPYLTNCVIPPLTPAKPVAYVPSLTMTTSIYKFVGHTWSIDQSNAARQALGVLQLDSGGGFGGTTTDQAYGIVDLQVATLFYDNPTDASDTADPGTDGMRDWYSGAQQQTWTATPWGGGITSYLPLAMTMSLVARTAENVEGVSTANYPNLTVTGNTTNNTVGDRATFTLPHASLPAYQGNRIYRWITFQTDLRNMGVGF